MPDISPGKDASLKMKDQSSWANARDGTTATDTYINVAKVAGAVRIKRNAGSSAYDCARSFLAFDTSGISVAPTSATLKIYGYSGTDCDIIVVMGSKTGTGDSSTDYVAADFDAINGYVSGATMASNVTPYLDAQVATWSASAYNELTLNAAARADMAALSEFLVVVVSSDHDYTGTTPGAGQTDNAGIYFVSESDAAKRPLISYVAGPAADTGGPLGSTLQGPLTGPLMDVESPRRGE